nr:hypothetical protein [Tanacetum cinerariifolium]
GIKNVVVASDETRNNEKVADKEAGIKSAVVAFYDTRNDQQVDEKGAGIKNVVVASDDAQKNEQNAENEAGIKNVAASKEKCIDKDDHEDEKETGTDLGISLEKLSLGPNKKLLVLPLGGFVVHRAHRRRPNTFPKKSRPDFVSGNFMSK